MHVRSMQNVAKSLWGRIRGGGRELEVCSLVLNTLHHFNENLSSERRARKGVLAHP